MVRLFSTKVRDNHTFFIRRCVALIDTVTVSGMRPKNERFWPYDEWFFHQALHRSLLFFKYCRWSTLCLRYVWPLQILCMYCHIGEAWVTPSLAETALEARSFVFHCLQGKIGDLHDFSFMLPTKTANACMCTKPCVRMLFIWVCKWLSFAIVSWYGMSYSNEMRVKWWTMWG